MYHQKIIISKNRNAYMMHWLIGMTGNKQPLVLVRAEFMHNDLGKVIFTCLYFSQPMDKQMLLLSWPLMTYINF